MALDRTAVIPALKELYSEGEDTDLVLKSHPLLGMTRRKKDMQGEHFKLPIQYGKPQGRSHSITNAATAEVASKYAAFNVTPVSDYAVARVSGQVVRLSMNGGNAEMFLDLMKNEMDGALSTLGDNVAKEQFGSAGGFRARVHPTTAISTTSLTLANPEDSFFFEAGMEICAASTDGTSGSLRDSGQAITIASVNRDTGVLTADENWSEISGITNNDYLFQLGDFGAAASGLQTWVPASASGIADLFGVTRSNDPERLGGIRYDGSSDTQETVYIKARARVKRTKAKIKYIYTNPINTANLETAKEGAKFITTDNEYGIGYEGFRYGNVEIMEDNDCPVNTAWGIDPGAWFWCTNGDAPSIQNADGVEFLRLGASTGDTFEIQCVIDHNFASNAPGKLQRITLPTA
jgi:hypothetical protein